MTTKITIHGRQLELTDAIRKYAQERIVKFEKFNDSILKIDVTLSASKLKTGSQHIAEILVYISGKTIKATSKEDDLYYSIDKAADAIETQLIKYKEKYLKSHAKEKVTYKLASAGEDPNEKKIVKIFLSPKPMEVSEAILQMESLGRLFVTFRNEATGKMAVIYRRKDGDFGLIED